MGKCSVVLMYEGIRPVPVGMTDDQRMKVLVKRKLIEDAEVALQSAKVVGDHVLIARISSDVEKLRTTLDMLIPPELEGLYAD